MMGAIWMGWCDGCEWMCFFVLPQTSYVLLESLDGSVGTAWVDGNADGTCKFGTDLCLTQFSESKTTASANTAVMFLCITSHNRTQRAVGRTWAYFLSLLGTLQSAGFLLAC